jgi:protein O-GlcNAc transferase
MDWPSSMQGHVQSAMASITDDQRCRRDRAPSAWLEDGVVKILDTGRPVPDSLIEANRALGSGCAARAEALLVERDAAGECERLIQEEPSRVDLMYMVARLYLALENWDQAERWCQRIVEREPSALAHHQMATVYSRHWGKASQSLVHAREALEADPGNPMFHQAYAEGLIGLGRISEGMAVLAEAAGRFPNNESIHEGLLWYAHYVPGSTRRGFLEGYTEWARIATAGIRPRDGHRNVQDPDRRLRVGFISPDLRRNSAALSFEPFLDAYDRDRLEVFAYANVARPDDVTQRLKTKCDGFRMIHGLPAERAAQMIEDDQIDILVEIGGHVRDHSLTVCAHKPAPVQVDFGGVSTTGLKQIDYRLMTDAIIDPPDALGTYVEESVYLPGGMACFRPPQVSPLVRSLPAEANGFVTFGSFNSHIKITDAMLGLWAEILRANANSRLIMKFNAGGDPTLQNLYLGRFRSLGIDSGRIEIHGILPHFDYLELLGRVDLALDTHPFNGCITTLEGLWMGVPIVTLTGDTFVSRMGLTVLTRVGLDLFAASSAQEYVAKANAFAGQLKAIAQIRLALRSRMLGSPLCDPVRWAREMEHAFRLMWRSWCRGSV